MTNLHDGRKLPVIVLHAEIEDYGLDPYQMRVYIRIVRRAGKGECFESIANMAKGCGMSVGSVKRAIKFLLDHRFITRHTSGKAAGKPSTYRLTDLDLWIPSQESTWVVTDPGVDLTDPGVDLTDPGVDLTDPHKINPLISTSKEEKLKNIEPSQARFAIAPSQNPVESEREKEQLKSLTSHLDQVQSSTSPSKSGSGKEKGSAAPATKAEEIYAQLQDRERFESFWEWYRTKICSISGARVGRKTEAALAWIRLEQGDFFGEGINGFRDGCQLEWRGFIAARGVGVPHACRFLLPENTGEPDWLVSLRESRSGKSAQAITVPFVEAPAPPLQPANPLEQLPPADRRYAQNLITPNPVRDSIRASVESNPYLQRRS